MTLTSIGPVFRAIATYDERGIPKAAGFWWHGGDCRPTCQACAAKLPLRIWWTPDAEKARRLIRYADASALEALGARDESIEASRAATADIVVPAPPGCVFRPFQLAGVAYALARPATLLGDEMGTGKSIQTLGVINASPSMNRILIIAPATLRINWAREAEKWLVRPLKIHIVMDRILPPNDAQLVITHYDALIGKRGVPLVTALASRSWDLIVIDECHRLKNPRAQRTKTILGEKGRGGLVGKGAKTMMLTGTPILNKPVELWPILERIAPREFPSYWSFVKEFCGAKQNQWGWDFSGATNLDRLQTRLRASVMIRRRKVDVISEMPPKTRQVVEVAANGAASLVSLEQAAWRDSEKALEGLRADVELARAGDDDEAYKTAVEKLREGASIAFRQISKARHDLALAKVPHVIEHVSAILHEGEPKIVVMAHHKDVIAALAEGLADYGVVTLTGDTPQNKRQEAIDSFQAPGGPRIFIGSITAAGVGITLTAASIMCFAELTWVSAEITQAEDREWRIGAKNSVLIQHLVIDGSLDARMAKKLVEKQEIADAALDTIHDLEPVLPLDEMEEKAHKDTATRKGLIKAAEKMVDPAQIAAIHEGLRILDGMCDGTTAKDGRGFSKVTRIVGHALAILPTITARQAVLGRRIVLVHRKQIDATLLSLIENGKDAP